MDFKVRKFFMTHMVNGRLESDGDFYHVEVTAPDDGQDVMKVAMCLEDEDAQMLAKILSAAKDQPEVRAWVERMFTRWRDHLEALEASLNPTPVSPQVSPPSAPTPKPKLTRIRDRRWTQD